MFSVNDQQYVHMNPCMNMINMQGNPLEANKLEIRWLGNRDEAYHDYHRSSRFLQVIEHQSPVSNSRINHQFSNSRINHQCPNSGSGWIWWLVVQLLACICARSWQIKTGARWMARSAGQQHTNRRWRAIVDGARA